MSVFVNAKNDYDGTLGKSQKIDSLVPVNGKIKKNISIRNTKNEPNEEYYKWQFIYSLIYSGLYSKDYIGAEVSFPKGNKSSAPLKLDGAVFDDPSWIDHYRSYWEAKNSSELEWLNTHLMAVIEFKREESKEKEIQKIFSGQIKPAMREKDPSDAYVLGIYYDKERLLIFQRRNGLYLRYDESKNQKGDDSKAGDLSLHLPDPYVFIPSFEELKEKVHKPSTLDRSNRSIEDLGTITSIQTVQIQTALSYILRSLDKAGLVNQRGYHILLETFSLKIFDEKRNDKNKSKKLKFYVENDEATFSKISDSKAQNLIERLKALRSDAEGIYHTILKENSINWKNENHIRAIVSIIEAFQDYSFVRSSKSDLYQLIFYNFANSFKRDESAQFLTPLPVIDFLVKIVNPRNGENIIDPCCGIGDFLSLSYVNSQEKAFPYHLDDANIYGVDLDESMIMLATLNMLLNGDGEAKLFHKTDKGSILFKVQGGSTPSLVELNHNYHSKGTWDSWPDQTQLKKFDVVLTNPPFGEDRAYRPKSEHDLKVIELYESWDLAGSGKSKSIDLGVVFLENAVRILKEEGRFGIVLSNSITSINKWQKIREWLWEQVRIVAMFDLPPNVFAETGVNTSLLVGYKPKEKELEKLKDNDYSIFVKDIQNVGYEKRTSKRNVFFNPLYEIDKTTYEIRTDDYGAAILKEDFSQTLLDFKKWSLGQEETLKRLFLQED